MKSSPTKRILAAFLLGSHIVAGIPSVGLTTDVASTPSTSLRASGRAVEAQGPGEQTLVQNAIAAAASTSASPPTSDPPVPAPSNVVMHGSVDVSGSGLPPDDSVATIVTEERGNMTTTITIPSGRHPAPIGMGTSPSSSTSPTVPASAVPPPPVPPTPLGPSDVLTPTSSASQGSIPYPHTHQDPSDVQVVHPIPVVVVGPSDPQAPPPDLPRPDAPHKPDCDVVWDTTREPSCSSSLPPFLTQARPNVFSTLDAAQRHDVLEGLCSTHCGQVYTQQLLSHQSSHGHHSHHDACLLPPTPPPLPTQAANASATAGRGGAPLDTTDPLPEPSGPTQHRRLQDPQGPNSLRGSPLVRGLDTAGPVPDRYPGLRLGCTREEEGGRYCALLPADVPTQECSFYLSCCFGELLARDAALRADEAALRAVEQACPGSVEYRAAQCGGTGSSQAKGEGKPH